MHIPLPTTGDGESLEAFRKSIVALNGDAERYFSYIFGGRHGSFLWISEQIGTINGSDDAVKLQVHVYHPHSGTKTCEFIWRANGICDKIVLSEHRHLVGASLKGADWRVGAAEFLGTVSVFLRGIPAALAGLEQLSSDMESSLEQLKLSG